MFKKLLNIFKDKFKILDIFTISLLVPLILTILMQIIWFQLHYNTNSIIVGVCYITVILFFYWYLNLNENFDLDDFREARYPIASHLILIVIVVTVVNTVLFVSVYLMSGMFESIVEIFYPTPKPVRAPLRIEDIILYEYIDGYLWTEAQVKDYNTFLQNIDHELILTGIKNPENVLKPTIHEYFTLMEKGWWRNGMMFSVDDIKPPENK